MKRASLLLVLVALWPVMASAQTATPAPTATATPTATPTPKPLAFYPQVLMDSGCIDTNNVPAAQTGGSIRPAAQTSGTGDGYCDHDSRVREAAITADTSFGPFKRKPGRMGVRVFADSDVVSGDTNTWSLEILAARPHEPAVFDVVETEELATEANHVVSFGPNLLYDVAGVGNSNNNCAIPPTFYINMKFGTATSWDGNISWYQY